jgi:CD109 antigen
LKPASPGAETVITLKSTANSFVGILAVDKSVLLHKTGNDIDKKRVFADLLRYDPSAGYEPLEIKGSHSSYKDFGGSSSFILTDAFHELLKETSNRFNEDYSDENINDDDIFDENWGIELETSEAEDLTNIKVRKEFPETWIFQSFTVDGSGNFVIRKHVPDTITSWVITGFSLDEENGLGISESQSLFVKQNFFLKLNLPYSIRWAEILRVEVSVFNYATKGKLNLSVEVELFRDEIDPDFEFIKKNTHSKCTYETLTINSCSEIKSVAQNSMSTVAFHIKPLKTGKIRLNVRAVGTQAGEKQVKVVDAVEKEILVENEGISHYQNHPVMIDLVKGDFDSYGYVVEFPKETIPKSVKVGVSVAGDLIGTVLHDVSNLM